MIEIPNSEFILKQNIIQPIINEEEKGNYDLQPLMLASIKEKYLDKGFVELIQNSGYDFTPVERQRISYNQNKNKTYTKDLKLLNDLQKNGHMTPFEHINFTFKVKVPIFVQRHIVKYRISTINEISGRYTNDNKNEFYIPGEFRLELNKKLNKEQQLEQINIITETYNTIEKNYNKLIKLGVTKELQRVIQPVGQYTTFYWTLNMREFFHVCLQRLTKHAQMETSLLVQTMYEILYQVYPLNLNQFYHKIQTPENKDYIGLFELS